MPTRIQLPLEIPDVEVLSTECRPDGARLIPVESTRQGSCWSRWGRETHPFPRDDRPIQWRPRPLLERRVYLAMRPQRYRCPPGEGRPPTPQRGDGDEPTSPPTQALEKEVWRRRVNRTVAEVRNKSGLGPDAVAGSLGRGVSTTVDGSRWTTRETLGMDASVLTWGQGNSVAVISPRAAPGQGSVLAVGPDRLQAPVKALLEAMPAPLKAPIQTVGTDRYDGYTNAAAAALPGVTVGVERFPVAPSYHDGVDPLRKQELKRLPQALPEAEDEPLQGWLGGFARTGPC